MAPRNPPDRIPAPSKHTGRPPMLNDLSPVPSADGEQVTLGEQIARDIRATGCDVAVCSDRMRVPRATLHAWLRNGAEAAIKSARGQKLTLGEQQYLDFRFAIDAAASDWEMRMNAYLADLARGKILQEVVTIKVDGNGVEIERSTKRSHTLPDAATVRWLLETKRRKSYGRTVAVTGEGGGPIAVEVAEVDRVQGLIDQITAYQQGHADAIIDGATAPGASPVAP